MIFEDAGKRLNRSVTFKKLFLNLFLLYLVANNNFSRKIINDNH
jgi:hypothetical protein